MALNVRKVFFVWFGLFWFNFLLDQHYRIFRTVWDQSRFRRWTWSWTYWLYWFLDWPLKLNLIDCPLEAHAWSWTRLTVLIFGQTLEAELDWLYWFLDWPLKLNLTDCPLEIHPWSWTWLIVPSKLNLIDCTVFQTDGI